MIRPILASIAAFSLISCSTLPVPGEARATTSSKQAVDLLRESASRHGRPWQRCRSVAVEYDGEWSFVATRLQPVITDPGFRKSSREVYQPQRKQVRQIHQGKLGTKEVVRQGSSVAVRFNGVASDDPEVRAAAALVADAYTVFLFGSSWLLENGRELNVLESRKLDGEGCHLVAGRLRPGIGHEGDDHFIAWIGKESGLMKRVQLSLNGMDSTRGADVDVVFSDFRKTADGLVLPRHFLEYIQRPVKAKAHEWRMLSLKTEMASGR